MEQGHVDAALRDETSSLRKLRDTGFIPAVLYGGSQPSEPIAVPLRELQMNVSAARKFVELTVNNTTVTALIQDLQTHPVSKQITHADFYRIDMNQPAHFEVPIHLIGVDGAVRQGHIIQQQQRTIAVSALPKDAPEYIALDVSTLTPGQHLSVTDVVFPAGVTPQTDANDVLVTVMARPTLTVPEADESESREQPAAEE